MCAPERVGKVCLILEECLRTKTGINIHLGKTKLWNRAGTKPDLADSLSAAAQAVKPEAVVWRGDPQLPLHKQGLTVLGVPVGQPEFVVAELTAKAEEPVCSRRSHTSLTFRLVGCSWCSVPPRGQIIGSGQCPPS